MGRFSKKTIAIAIGVVVVLGGAGIAFAFFSGTGGGTGTVSVAAAQTAVVIVQNPVVGLQPGGPALPLTGTYTNANTGAVHIVSMTAVVTSVAPETCLVADYVIAYGNSPTNSIIVNHDVTPGTDSTEWGGTPATGATISMTSTTENQDTCKGATVTVTYTAI